MIKLILKGVLLYVTILTVLIFMMSIDSLYDSSYLSHGVAIVAVLLYLSFSLISAEELDKLSPDNILKWKRSEKL